MDEELLKLLMEMSPEQREAFFAENPGTDKSAFMAGVDSLRGLNSVDQDKAITELGADYEGRRDNLRDDLTMAYDQFTTPTPEALQGPGGNPYAYTVAASPLEHLAAGVQKYQGGKELKRVRGEREKLSAMQEAATKRTLAAALRAKEEEERLKRLGLMPRSFGYGQESA